jgi:putative transcriptional regulator
MDGKMDYKKVGCEIQVRRTRNGITQTEFAKFLGISQTHLSNVESGRVMLSLKMLLKIKQRFVCTLDEIVDQEGYKELLNSKNKLRRFRLVRCDE